MEASEVQLQLLRVHQEQMAQASILHRHGTRLAMLTPPTPGSSPGSQKCESSLAFTHRRHYACALRHPTKHDLYSSALHSSSENACDTKKRYGLARRYGYSFGCSSVDVWHYTDHRAMLYPGYMPYSTAGIVFL